ncbi:MAG: hypothetical protein ACREPY_02405 [Rhodanobacteraceae bacterium]
MHPRLPIAVFVFALVAAGAQAAPPGAVASAPPAPSDTTASPAAPHLSTADRKRVKAIQQYRHDLVSVVALRVDPDYLLGAAILAKPFQHQTPGLDFASLSERAASATSAGPAVAWSRLGLCKNKADCPNTKAFDSLKKHAADNAAVWLVALDFALANHDAKAEQAALAQAAAAQSYDDYFGKALAAVAKAVTVLPPLADTTRDAHDGQPDNPRGVRVLVAVMSTRAHPRPDLGPLLQLCDPRDAAKHAERKADCLKLARTLQWGSSPIARAAGLHIQGELDPSAKTRTGAAARNLAWQVQQYSGLLQHALVDPKLASGWLASARNGGTELSLILATLRANHISIEAPAGFTPATAGDSDH